MIEGFSEFVVIGLGPVLMIVSFVLIVVTFLAPTMLFHASVALLTVTSANQTLDPVQDTGSVGPSLFLGALGSCGRYANSTKILCTNSSLSPTYNTSAIQIPDSTAYTILSYSPATAADFILLSLVLSFLFFVGYTAQCIQQAKKIEIWAPFRSRYVATCGVFGFFTGIIPFIVMRMWFEEMLTDYNAVEDVEMGGRQGLVLLAATGHGFTMAWVAYAFYLVPLVASFSGISKDRRAVHVQQHNESTYVHANRNNLEAVTTHRDLSYDVEK